MNVQISWAFWAGIVGALASAGVSYTNGFYKAALSSIGVVAYSFAGAILLFFLLDQARAFMSVASAAIVEIMNPEIMILQKASQLQHEWQADLYFHEVGYLVETETGRGIYHLGLVLEPDWVETYLKRCEAQFPNFPAIRIQDDGTVEYTSEFTIRDYAVKKGWGRKREGQTMIWIDGNNPERIIEELQLDN